MPLTGRARRLYRFHLFHMDGCTRLARSSGHRGAPMPPSASISVIEVAQHAGVGVGPVSRVINRHPKVLPVTVPAVRRAMAALGYQPLAPENRRGRRSRSHAAKRISLVIIG